MAVKIDRIPPLKCPECGSDDPNEEKKGTNVSKKGKTKIVISCYDCGFDYEIKTGKKTKRPKISTGKGHDPRYDTGDYLE